jgi:hypothetical protein
MEAMKGTTAGVIFCERLSATLEGHKQWRSKLIRVVTYDYRIRNIEAYPF